MPLPLEAAIQHPVRRQLLRTMLPGNVLTLDQLAMTSRLSLPAALYHLRVLGQVEAISRSQPKPAGPVTYEANLDVLPEWIRERIESGEELAR